MPDVVGIRFKRCGKIYDFEVNGIEVSRGDFVVVESDMGLNLGSVVTERHSVENPETALKKVVRKATDEDIRQKQENRALGEEAMAFCIERIMARGLPMKMVATEVTLDRKRIIFYFTADGRIDFRELVKDLAARFKTRIEMRQVGGRDSARIVGGIGICGRELCCKTFLISFEPISIKMAKSQELVLNANKLSGLCGRLMCCLSYEYGEHGKAAAERETDETAEEKSLEEETEERPVALSEESETKMRHAPRQRGEREAAKPDQRSRSERGGLKQRRLHGQQPRIRPDRPEEKAKMPEVPQQPHAQIQSQEGRPATPEETPGEKPTGERKSHRRRRNERRFKK